MNQTVQFTQCGVKVWDPDDVLIINHTEGTTVNLNYMKIWYDVNGELGVTLKKGATYRFQFWCTGGGKTFYSDNSYFTTTGSYTVTFNANGHGSAPSAQSLKYNDTVTKPSDLTASGYTFGGWYTNASCTSAYNFSRKVTSDFTLYAKWTKNYTVTFNANGHGTAPSSQTVTAGSRASRPSNPTASGYTFGGWYTDSSCTNAFDFSTSINANVTLYAKWTKDVIDLSSAKVTLPYARTPYTGKAITPKPTVTLDGATLSEGTDYEVSYANNVNVGTATVTVTGVGGYEGTAKATFTIARAGDGWVTLADGSKGYGRGGKLVTGWLDLDGGKYWFDDQGRMAIGWTDVVVDGKTMHYYFNPASGNLARGTWMEIDGKKYYFRPSGNMATGWATISDNGVDKKYYFDESGQMVTGWQDIDNGAGATNHYYFRPSGSMATGWAQIDGASYYFRPSGNMATGFADVTDDAYKRYFDESGRMLTGWQEIGGSTYYFRSSGAMQTGEATIDGMIFTFNDKGVLVDDAPSAKAAMVELEAEEFVADDAAVDEAVVEETVAAAEAEAEVVDENAADEEEESVDTSVLEVETDVDVDAEIDAAASEVQE